MTIDLITGFLGAGKTTFLCRYAAHFAKRGEKICVLLNDHGAVNVDMLLSDALSALSVDFQMVAGGCDADCHRRRFKTKLIAMGLSEARYDRVIVEPSGIFDPEEFFDLLYEEPLDRLYQVGAVLAVVSPRLPKALSAEDAYYLAAELAPAGRILFSRGKEASEETLRSVKETIGRAFAAVSCDRTLQDTDYFIKDWDALTEADFSALSSAGYVRAEHIRKRFSDEEGYRTIYLMHFNLPVEKMRSWAEATFREGGKDAFQRIKNVSRIKGFFKESEDPTAPYYQINAVPGEVRIEPAGAAQDVIIVIGTG